jgi:hypothetical protein
MDRLGGSTTVLPAINYSHFPSNPSLGPIRRPKDLAEALIKQQLTSHWPGFRATETVSVHPPIFVRFDQSCGLRHWRLRHQAFSQGKLAMPELMYSRPQWRRGASRTTTWPLRRPPHRPTTRSPTRPTRDCADQSTASGLVCVTPPRRNATQLDDVSPRHGLPIGFSVSRLPQRARTKGAAGSQEPRFRGSNNFRDPLSIHISWEWWSSYHPLAPPPSVVSSVALIALTNLLLASRVHCTSYLDVNCPFYCALLLSRHHNNAPLCRTLPLSLLLY